MTGTKGHFEGGAWIEEKIPEEGEEAPGPSMESRIQEVSEDISGTMGKVISLARDLFTTEEGRKHIQKKVNDAGAHLESAVKDIISESEKVLERKKDEAEGEKKEIKIK